MTEAAEGIRGSDGFNTGAQIIGNFFDLLSLVLHLANGGFDAGYLKVGACVGSEGVAYVVVSISEKSVYALNEECADLFADAFEQNVIGLMYGSETQDGPPIEAPHLVVAGFVRKALAQVTRLNAGPSTRQ